jgi:hypothetical protein
MVYKTIKYLSGEKTNLWYLNNQSEIPPTIDTETNG